MSELSMSLEDRVAIVTGGASGIGRAIVVKAAEAGAAGVVIADIDEKGAAETAALVESGSRARCISVRTDVTDERQVGAMVDTAVAAFGRIDILFNNAGICPMAAWDDADVASWKRILDVNLTGMYICARAVLPHMRRRGYGRIVFVSSMGGLLGSIVSHVAYGVSKAGILALMKSVAKTFAGEGILANALCPGSIETPMTESFGVKTKQALAEACLLKRQGTPEELADAAIFLASDRSTFITGTVLNVNGGILT
jgi:NAD(P)-dependent dehydrogenase (short-subunit alcohol dehydrogenase family)